MLVGKKKAYEVKFMSIFNLLSMIGGLSLFLYGMSAMGDGLAKMAGGKLEAILEKIKKKKIFAVLLGAGVTAVIQSSSATTVMVVGFVNSGIMKLSKAVGTGECKFGVLPVDAEVLEVDVPCAVLLLAGILAGLELLDDVFGGTVLYERGLPGVSVEGDVDAAGAADEHTSAVG